MANEKLQKVLFKRTTKTNAPNVPSGASYGELFINIASGANAHNKIATKQIGTGTPIVWSDDVANDKKYATKTSIPTSGTVSGWGFTKNAGTVTSIKVQGTNGLTGSGTVTASGTITISGATATSATTGVSKLITGELSGKTYTAGEAAAAAHTHGQYLTGYTEQYTGTITGIKMNNASKGTSGVIDLGAVLTSTAINVNSATTATSATTAAKAVADGNGNNIANTYATTGHTHSNYLSMKSCNNTDFNTLKTSGWYYGYTGMTNAAYPNSISVTEVIVYSADWLVQRQTKIGNINGSTTDTWERHFSNGNTWSSWVKVSNTQADWDTTGTTSSSYIKNKPNIIYGLTGSTQQNRDSSGIALALIEGTGGVDLSSNTLYLPKLPASVITSGTFATDRIPTAIKVDSAKTATNATTATKANSATTVYSTTGNTSSTYQLLGTTASSSGAYGTIGSSLSSIKMNPSTGTLSATTFSGTLNGKIKATTGTSKYYLLGHSLSSNTADSVYKNANVYMSGGTLFASSDERLKTFIENVDGDPEKIKQIPKVYFHWNDDEEKNRQLGTFAQGLEKVYPELVCKDEDGTRGVSYDKLSVVSLAGIDKLYEMIQELQKKNEELEKRIKDLENK